jgi:hypothetical protein
MARGGRVVTERRSSLPFAVVQHGHQQLITDGYDNREGISDVVDAFAAVLEQHLRCRVPLNLHLSGMLIEAIAWRHAGFLRLVRELRADGLLELLGSTYAQSIMPLFSPEHAVRGINEELTLIERHLGAASTDIRVCWLPERVWSRDAGSMLCDKRLANGGFRAVVFDDRLRYPLRDGEYDGSERQRFDAEGPPFAYQYGASQNGAHAEPVHPLRTDQLQPWRIAGGGGLVALPIAAELRYAIPPNADDRWQRLDGFVDRALDETRGIAIYADDLEKSAVVGPWGSGRWDREGVRYYEEFLRWLSDDPRCEAVLLSDWLDGLGRFEELSTDPGTFYELAHPMGAGEDYRRWWDGAGWAPYRRHLDDAEGALRKAEAGHVDAALVDLGWKQLLASAYESAWHDLDGAGLPQPTPWARAAASHARSVHVILAAARWMPEASSDARVELADVDGDGEDELVVANEALFAVFAPAHGGRLVYLFDLTGDGGRLVVGNPADSWNWQKELNRFMDRPRAHPGALCDSGGEHDCYQAAVATANGRRVEASMLNVQADSPLFGSEKHIALAAGARAIEVTYTYPMYADRPTIELGLSPDYARLLREGGACMRAIGGATWRGWQHGSTRVWVAIRDGEARWLEPSGDCGSHFRLVALQPSVRRFGLRVGVGAHARPAKVVRDRTGVAVRGARTRATE